MNEYQELHCDGRPEDQFEPHEDPRQKDSEEPLKESEVIDSVGEGDDRLCVWRTEYADHFTYWVSDADGTEIIDFIAKKNNRPWMTRQFAISWTTGYYFGRRDAKNES